MKKFLVFKKITFKKQLILNKLKKRIKRWAKKRNQGMLNIWNLPALFNL
jgi:hypothetical protein